MVCAVVKADRPRALLKRLGGNLWPLRALRGEAVPNYKLTARFADDGTPQTPTELQFIIFSAN